LVLALLIISSSAESSPVDTFIDSVERRNPGKPIVARRNHLDEEQE
jgi:hypothetical protein